jgi:putative spermidine/putrescine transport system substrate-binding protein
MLDIKKQLGISRRSFLIGAGTLTLGQLLSGCSQDSALRVRLLKGSIPSQLFAQFRKLTDGNAISFKLEPQLKNLWELLETWSKKPELGHSPLSWIPFIGQNSPAIADLVSLGDSWLTQGIQAKLIQPFNVSDLTRWKDLPTPFTKLVRRNNQGMLDERGEIWGIPYRWGTTMIAYRRDKFEKLGWKPQDWSDLWHPDLRDHISLVNQPREVLGLTLKKLGYSYNTLDLNKIPNLKAELLELAKQIKFYSSEYYLEPLILGDTWVAVGWSSDILSIQSRYPKIEAVVPKSGTSLWSDIWVKPAPGNLNSLAKQWIEFCWEFKSASLISLFTDGVSPMILSLKNDELPKDIRDNSLLFPERKIFDKSEFIEPLPPAVWEKYLFLWREMREMK